MTFGGWLGFGEGVGVASGSDGVDGSDEWGRFTRTIFVFLAGGLAIADGWAEFTTTILILFAGRSASGSSGARLRLRLRGLCSGGFLMSIVCTMCWAPENS
jgi:hypothetical protein